MKKIVQDTTYIKPDRVNEIVDQYNKIMHANQSQYPQIVPNFVTPNFNLELQEISPLKVAGVKFSVSGNCK